MMKVRRLHDSIPQFSLGTGKWIHLLAPKKFIAEKWCHFAGTSDGNNMRIFIDGVEQGSTRLHADFVRSLPPLTIGRHSYETRYTFTGSLSQVLLFNRALSADEIAKLAESKS
jgi:hypothetical protein